jgi:hypothetical protein
VKSSLTPVKGVLSGDPAGGEELVVARAPVAVRAGADDVGLLVQLDVDPAAVRTVTSASW